MAKVCCICGKEVKGWHREVGRYVICDNGCSREFSEWKESEKCLQDYMTFVNIAT